MIRINNRDYYLAEFGIVKVYNPSITVIFDSGYSHFFFFAGLLCRKSPTLFSRMFYKNTNNIGEGIV